MVAPDPAGAMLAGAGSLAAGAAAAAPAAARVPGAGSGAARASAAAAARRSVGRLRLLLAMTLLRLASLLLTLPLLPLLLVLLPELLLLLLLVTPLCRALLYWSMPRPWPTLISPGSPTPPPPAGVWRTCWAPPSAPLRTLVGRPGCCCGTALWLPLGAASSCRHLRTLARCVTAPRGAAAMPRGLPYCCHTPGLAAMPWLSAVPAAIPRGPTAGPAACSPVG